MAVTRFTITPTKTSPGPIDETVTYTLHASNACGGSETRTATPAHHGLD